MSKYEPLAKFLGGRSQSVWQAEFSRIERVLGFPLPRSAYRYPAWWANQNGKGHSQTAGWRPAGWRTSGLDLQRRKVTFEREGEDVREAMDFLMRLGGTMPGYKAPPRS